MNIKPGDVIKLHPEHMNPGDEELTYRCDAWWGCAGLFECDEHEHFPHKPVFRIPLVHIKEVIKS